MPPHFLVDAALRKGGRGATHSPDLGLITAYLVVNNSNSAEARGGEEDGALPDGCLVPFVPPRGPQSSPAWLAAPGQRELVGRSVHLSALHSAASSLRAANAIFPGIKYREIEGFFFVEFNRNLHRMQLSQYSLEKDEFSINSRVGVALSSSIGEFGMSNSAALAGDDEVKEAVFWTTYF